MVVEGRERTRHSFLCCRSVLTSRDMCVCTKSIQQRGTKEDDASNFLDKEKKERDLLARV